MSASLIYIEATLYKFKARGLSTLEAVCHYQNVYFVEMLPSPNWSPKESGAPGGAGVPTQRSSFHSYSLPKPPNYAYNQEQPAIAVASTASLLHLMAFGMLHQKHLSVFRSTVTQ